jgi:hypothetical protein
VTARHKDSTITAGNGMQIRTKCIKDWIGNAQEPTVLYTATTYQREMKKNLAGKKTQCTIIFHLGKLFTSSVQNTELLERSGGYRGLVDTTKPCRCISSNLDPMAWDIGKEKYNTLIWKTAYIDFHPNHRFDK